ncbi:carboxyvinyl-carboxyphosphonate phosphorylmutase [Dyadobacter endophyticus]|uniref:Carboxyvinyl-carboxyphosphonate phosphorylmutase n=1 Tax=Dyadobacter endophyticus TaxID=1749036 RepID=A0ABQ1YWL8_9BACT|nr:isocitrate lyase/phosphoenolpyruvate mutase family protein [Dyadobacter endophyticus]GGH40498.1 carboxyvinyl-carboxyphosphonate phosphorylmutase [Dyadobacter endophyticus]
MSTFETFSQLHQQTEPFLLGNIWDVNSAHIFEAAGYKAIGTSSHALAAAFGYDDGENLPFDTLLRVAKRVVATVKVPFTVDMEGGYSDTAEGIIEHIKMLHEAGVAGINLEDTRAKPSRRFRPVDEFKQLLTEIADGLEQKNIKMFLNVRTDAFLLGLPNALDETISRINIYENTGIHGIFVPGVARAEDINTITRETILPVNVMCVPALPDFNSLKSLNVKRISMGPFLFNKISAQTGTLAKNIIEAQNFAPLFS